VKIADFLINCIKERCAALESEVCRLLVTHSTSPGATSLLKLIEDTNRQILDKIETIAKSTTIRNTLTNAQLEQSLNRFAKLLPTLHELLSFLEGTERKGSFFPFAHPLRRLMRKHIEECEVVFASRPELNYSFEEVSSPIRSILNAASLNDICNIFPKYFLIISFPQAEAENILLHCIFAHEIGHAVYQKENLVDRILGRVKVSKEQIKNLSSEALMSHRGSRRLNKTAIQIREQITEEINKSAESWADELTSDAIAVCLFGPAYLFAFIHLIISFQLMDNCSDTHPSPRLRLRLICQMMDLLKYTRHFPGPLRKYYGPWKREASRPVQVDNPILKVVSRSFEPVLSAIIQQTLKTVKPQYTDSTYAADIKTLPQLIIAGILPVEVVKDHKKRTMQTQSVISILNAGWLVNLTALDEFAKSRHLKTADPFKVKRKLQEEISKALELQEITTMWKELHNA
jgi:hypothetical protein